MTMGDRIVVMKDGIIQQVDAPLNLYNNPVNKFVAGFIGSPAMNFIVGEIMDDNGLKFVSSKKSLIISLDKIQAAKLSSYTNKKVIVGIRPESFSVEPIYENKVQAYIDVVEQMGNESFLYFNLDDSQFIARTKAESMIQFGGKITLYINNSAVYLFTEEDNKRIIF